MKPEKVDVLTLIFLVERHYFEVKPFVSNIVSLVELNLTLETKNMEMQLLP